MRRTEKYCVARIGLEVREGFHFFGMLMKTVHPNIRMIWRERSKVGGCFLSRKEVLGPTAQVLSVDLRTG